MKTSAEHAGGQLLVFWRLLNPPQSKPHRSRLKRSFKYGRPGAKMQRIDPEKDVRLPDVTDPSDSADPKYVSAHSAMSLTIEAMLLQRRGMPGDVGKS